jgi:SPP1 family predicted phage head-tail adaptor
MRAGTLDRRVELWEERWVFVPLAGQEKQNVYLRTIWASREDQGGKAFMASGVEFNEIRAVFRIRYAADVSTNMRIKHDGDDFEIEGISEIGRREGLELLCRAVN